jgi:hypothetical protein
MSTSHILQSKLQNLTSEGLEKLAEEIVQKLYDDNIITEAIYFDRGHRKLNTIVFGILDSRLPDPKEMQLII